jgi:hypothetical protein
VRRQLYGLAMSCRRKTWLIFLFGRTRIIRCFMFFYICPYCPELIVALLSKNSTNEIPSFYQKPWLIGRCGGWWPLSFSPLQNDGSASKWANIYGILTIRASQVLTLLSQTAAFRTVCLVRTSTTSTVLHCYFVERTWLTGAPMILVNLELPLPVGKARNSTRCHIKNKELLSRRPSYCHDSKLDGLRGTKTSFRRVCDPAELWTGHTRYRFSKLAWCFAFTWFMAPDVFGRL